MTSEARQPIGKEGYPFNEQWLHMRVADLIAAAAAVQVPGAYAGEVIYNAADDIYVLHFRYSGLGPTILLWVPGAAIRDPEHADAMTAHWIGRELATKVDDACAAWRERYMKRYLPRVT